jgi:hypothetical protein
VEDVSGLCRVGYFRDYLHLFLCCGDKTKVSTALVLWMSCPDTLGRTLEEMSEIFEAPNPVRASLKRTTKTERV